MGQRLRRSDRPTTRVNRLRHRRRPGGLSQARSLGSSSESLPVTAAGGGRRPRLAAVTHWQVVSSEVSLAPGSVARRPGFGPGRRRHDAAPGPADAARRPGPAASPTVTAVTGPGKHHDYGNSALASPLSSPNKVTSQEPPQGLGSNDRLGLEPVRTRNSVPVGDNELPAALPAPGARAGTEEIPSCPP